MRILECSICTDFPIGPIYNCAQGHFICSGCISIIDNCPTCQSAFTKIRNYALENIIEVTKFKCRYQNEGCEQSILGQAYLQHLNDCVFR